MRALVLISFSTLSVLVLASTFVRKKVASFSTVPTPLFRLNQQSLQRGRQSLAPLFVSETSTTTIEPKRQDSTKEVVDLPQSSLAQPVPMIDVMTSVVWGSSNAHNRSGDYQRGIFTISFITLLFASNSPVLHAAFSGENSSAPPVLLLNAAVSVVALVGLLLGGEILESNTLLATSIKTTSASQQDRLTLRAGCELGVWKFLGTTANLYGLALTTASHGALLIQLTTLIVPVVQGLQGVPIPRRIQASVILALAGVVCFTQDPTGTPSAIGDALCILAAIFYATYDLRLFTWGKRVVPRNLITTKIGTQAVLSLILLLALGGQETSKFLVTSNDDTWKAILPVILWSGVAVNAVAPFLQVSGQQIVGPTRCQTIYASQPLWAAMMSFVWLGETIGIQGLIGGTAFLSALFLAATAQAPQEDCGSRICEV